jgi:hypothetical protein
MGWSIGYDTRWKRDIGYAVPAYCDAPGCREEIDRGLGYVCCGQQPYGGDNGCGLFFCSKHSDMSGRCAHCKGGKPPYKRIAPEHPKWIAWKLVHPSWEKFRVNEPAWVKANTSPEALELGRKLLAAESEP